MVVELINTGSELMLGRVLNTHQQWLGRQLADLGYEVTRQVAVPDTAPAIEQSVREALTRADLILTTGGLGPTSDDLTRELVAQLLGRRLHEHAPSLEVIKQFFAQRQRPMPAGNQVQAMVPEGALVLANPWGTAPGLAIQLEAHPSSATRRSRWLIMLPGPPRELRPMFTGSVAPLLLRELPPPQPWVCRTLRTTGIGESTVQEKIAGPLGALGLPGLELGYCAHMGQVDVRLAARGSGAPATVAQAEALVRAQLGNAIFGEGDEELEAVIIRGLTVRQQTLSLAESCTGGGLADRLTNVPGASKVFLGGWVTYTNPLKEQCLGVPHALLQAHGAVSQAVAAAMAQGARRLSGSDYALAVTGIAGPGGGTPQKPVGTVFLALASSQPTEVWQQFNPWDRLAFKELTCRQALNLLRLRLLALPTPAGPVAPA